MLTQINTQRDTPPDPFSGDPYSAFYVVFRHIPGMPGCGADSDGGIWTCIDESRPRLERLRGFDGEWRRVGDSPDAFGYRHVSLHVNGTRKRFSVHQLVALAFLGPCPAGERVRHVVRRDPWDNRVYNLAYGTQKQNMADKFRHGTMATGSDCRHAVLTEEIIRSAHADHAKGETVASIARRLGVSRSALTEAVFGRKWKHLNLPLLSNPGKSGRKLSKSDIARIRRSISGGTPQVEVARRFGLHPNTICLIKTGKYRSKTAALA